MFGDTGSGLMFDNMEDNDNGDYAKFQTTSDKVEIGNINSSSRHQVLQRKLAEMRKLQVSDDEEDSGMSPIGSPTDSSNFEGLSKFLSLKQRLEEHQAKRSMTSAENIDGGDQLDGPLVGGVIDVESLLESIQSSYSHSHSHNQSIASTRTDNPRFNDLCLQIKERDTRILELESRLQEMERQSIDFADALSEKDKLLGSKNQAIAVVQTKFDKELGKKELELETTQKMLFDMEKTLSSVQDKWKLEKDRLNLSIQSMELKTNNMNAEAQNEKKKLAAEIHDLKVKNGKVIQKCRSLKDKYDSLAKEHEALKNKNECSLEAEVEAESLRAQVQQKDELIAESGKIVAELTDEKERMAQRLDLLERVNDELIEMKESRGDYEQVLFEKKRLEDMEAELRAQIQQKDAENGKIMAELSGEKERIEQRLEIANAELLEMKESQGDYERVLSEKMRLEEKISLISLEGDGNAELRAQIQQKDDLILESGQSMVELMGEKERMAQRLDLLERANNELIEMKESQENYIELVLFEKKQLEEKINSEGDMEAELRAQIQQKDEHNTREIVGLEAEIARLQEGLNFETANMAQEVVRMQALVLEKEALVQENTALKQERDNLALAQKVAETVKEAESVAVIDWGQETQASAAQAKPAPDTDWWCPKENVSGDWGEGEDAPDNPFVTVTAAIKEPMPSCPSFSDEQFHKLQVLIDDKEANLQEQQFQLASLQESVVLLTTRIAELNTANEILFQQNAELQFEKNVVNNEVGRLKLQVENLSRSRTELSSSRSTSPIKFPSSPFPVPGTGPVEEDLVTKQEPYLTFPSQLDDDEKKKLLADIQELKSKYAKVIQKFRGLKDKYDSLVKDHEGLKTKTKNKGEFSLEGNMEAELRARMQQKEEENWKIMAELSGEKERMAQRLDLLERANFELLEVKERQGNYIEQVLIEKKRLEERISAEGDMETESLRAQIQQKDELIAENRKIMAELMGEKEGLALRLDLLERANHELIEGKESQGNYIEQMLFEKQRLEEKSGLEGDMEAELRAQIQQKDKENWKIMAELSGEKEQMAQRLDLLERANNELIQMKESQRDYEQVLSEKMRLEEKISLISLEGDMDAELRAQIQQKDDLILESGQSMVELMGEKERMAQRLDLLERANNELIEMKESQGNYIELVLFEKKQLEEKINSEGDMEAELRTQLQQKDEHIQEIAKTMAKLISEKEHVAQKLDSLERANVELLELKESQKNYIEQVLSEKKRLEEKISSEADMEAELRAQIQQKNEHNTKEIVELNERLSQVQYYSEANYQQVKILQQELSNREQDLDRLREYYEPQLAQVAALTETLEQANQALSQRDASLLQQRIELETEIARVQDELNSEIARAQEELNLEAVHMAREVARMQALELEKDTLVQENTALKLDRDDLAFALAQKVAETETEPESVAVIDWGQDTQTSAVQAQTKPAPDTDWWSPKENVAGDWAEVDDAPNNPFVTAASKQPIEEQLRQLRSLIDDKEANLQEQQFQLASLQESVVLLTTRITELNTANEILSYQNSELQFEKNVVNNEVGRLKLQVDNLSRSRTEPSSSRSPSPSKFPSSSPPVPVDEPLAKKEEVYLTGQTSTVDVDEEKKKLVVEIRELKAKNGKMLQKFRLLVREHEALKTKNEFSLEGTMEAELLVQLKQKDELITENSKIMAELSGEKERIAQRLDLLERANDKLLEMKESQGQYIEQVLYEKKRLEEEISGLKWKLEEVAEGVGAGIGTGSDEPRNQFESVDLEAVDNSNANAVSSEEIETLRHQMYLASKEIISLQQDNEDLLAGIEELNKRNLALQSASEPTQTGTGPGDIGLGQLQAALDDERKDKVVLERKIELLQGKILEIEASEIKCFEESFMLKSWTRQLEMDNSKYQEELEQLLSNSMDGDGSGSKVSVLQNEILRLVDTLQERDKRCEELVMEITRMLEERDGLQLKLSNVLKHNVSLNEQVSEATDMPSKQVPMFDHEELQLKLADLEQINFAIELDLRREREARRIVQEQLLFSHSSRIYRDLTRNKPLTIMTPMRTSSPKPPTTPAQFSPVPSTSIPSHVVFSNYQQQQPGIPAPGQSSRMTAQLPVTPVKQI